MADEPIQAADPITPPESHPPDAKPLVDSPVEQASPVPDEASSQDAPPDPEAEQRAYLKSLPREKLLAERADLAQEIQDKINRGVQSVLSKERDKERKQAEAQVALQAAADARAQRETDRLAKRDLARKSRAGEYETRDQLADQMTDILEADAFGSDPADAPDLDALANQVWGQAFQGITQKIHADILNDPRTKGISAEAIKDLIEGARFTDMAFNVTEAAGGAGPEKLAALLAAKDKEHATELEATARAAKAEALGELPEHDVPRGVGAGNGNGVPTREALQAMSATDRIAWRDKNPHLVDAMTRHLTRA